MPEEHLEHATKILVEMEWWMAFLLIAGFGVVQFLISILIKNRLEKSIGLHYSKQLEEYKYQMEARKEAAKVAEYLSSLFQNPDAKSPELNKTAWELALWLPSEVYRKMAVTVVENRDLRSFKELLIEVRQVLKNPPSENDKKPLNWDNIIHHLDKANTTSDSEPIGENGVATKSI